MFGEWNGLVLQFGGTLVVVLALIALVYWLVRRYAIGGLGRIGRGRVPRLAVVDAMAVDGRRRLVLVRRDNVEHLILIGGPSDLVVEHSIQRARRPMARPTAAGEVQPGEPHAEAVSPPVADNPPIPFPQGRAPDLHPANGEELAAFQPAAHQPVSQAGDRPFFPLRRASAGQPSRLEPARTAEQLHESDDEGPRSAMIDGDSRAAADAQPAAEANGRDQSPPSFASEAAAAAPNVTPFPPPPTPAHDPATKVGDLEREMARLLGEITGKRPA